MESTSQPSAAARRSVSPRIVMAIVSAGIVLVNLDLFIVNVALPDIAADFGEGDLDGLSWVLSAYAIVYASLLVLAGRLADRHSMRNGFLVGVVLFTSASIACGVSSSLGVLVAFRVIQAAGAALLTPTSLGLLLATVDEARRPAAVRAWTAVGAIGAALGPVVGGLLVAGSWRWIFFVNVPIGIAALVAGQRFLPNITGHGGPRPDAVGAVLVTGGVGALTLGIVEGGDWGWGSPATVAVLGASVVALALFVWRGNERADALVPASLFASRPFTGASLLATLFSMAFGGMLLSIALWEQTAWGWSALNTGLAIAPGPLMVPVMAFGVTGRLIARYGAAFVSSLGSAVFAAGIIWWVLAVGIEPDYAGGVLGGMLLTGMGVGLTMPTFMATAAASLPPASFATGSAVINMLRQIGIAVGVAVLVAVLGTSSSAADRLGAFQNGWTVIAAMALVASVAAALLMPRRVAALAPAPRRPEVAVAP